MIAAAMLIEILISHFLSGNPPGGLKSLENRAGVFFTAAQIVDFSDSGRRRKPVNERRDVECVDIVTDLLAFVSVDLVDALFEIAFDEVAQKAVQLNTGVVRTGQAAT